MDSTRLPDTVEQYIAKLQSSGELQLSFKIVDQADRKIVVLTWNNVTMEAPGYTSIQHGHNNFYSKYKSSSQLRRDKLRRAQYLQRQQIRRENSDQATVRNSCPRTENCSPPNKPNIESDQRSVKSKDHQAIHKNVVITGTGEPFKPNKTVPRNTVTKKSSSSISSGSSVDKQISTPRRSSKLSDSGHNMSTRSSVSRTSHITFDTTPRDAYKKNDSWYYKFCGNCSNHTDSNFRRWHHQYGMRLRPMTCLDFSWMCSSCGERGSCTDTSVIELLTGLSDQ